MSLSRCRFCGRDLGNDLRRKVCDNPDCRAKVKAEKRAYAQKLRGDAHTHCKECGSPIDRSVYMGVNYCGSACAETAKVRRQKLATSGSNPFPAEQTGN